MGKETSEWYNSQILAGDCETHGNPWWTDGQGVTNDDSTNLYPNAVPLHRVRQLFDFPVVSAPVVISMPDGSTLTTERQAIVREDTRDLFGIFGDGYVVHPYDEALLDNVSKIVQESAGDLHVDSAGLLSKGAEAWLSISTTGLLSTPQGVEFYPHIIASTSMNGTLSTTYKQVQTMVICDNTRAMALSEKTPTFKIKHTRYSGARLDSARQALGLLDLSADEFQAEVKLLCETAVTDAQWAAFVEELAPIAADAKPGRGLTMAENMRDSLNSLYWTDPRVTQWKGTAFGALQAVNTHDLWVRHTRGETGKADRSIREAITGKLDSREAERATLLGKILASV